MHERLLVELRENKNPIAVNAASDAGIVLRNEWDAFPRRVNIALVPRGEIMKRRVRWLCQRKGWPPNEWKLNVREDRGRIALSGAEADGLLPGRTRCAWT